MFVPKTGEPGFRFMVRVSLYRDRDTRDPDMTPDEVRSVSSYLFGNADRLRVAAAIGRMAGKPVSVKSVSAESGVDYNRTQEQIAWFRRAGVLIPDSDPDLRRKDYRVVELSYWSAAARLEEELRGMDHLG